MPRYRADVGVNGGRIAAIGRIRESAREVIDAEGQVVAPGFVDGHTHMDAQVFWDPLGTCSCWHGVTSVVMGNCGFTLAPCAKADRQLVMRNLERAEDIAREAMEAGIDWTWTTFAEFLDAVEALPKGINYSGYIGHSALRTYVMGERAFDQAATEDDLAAMEHELRRRSRAGAMGFTTSRSPSHETPDRRPVASRVATWDEVRRLVGVMGEMNAGIFELAGERVDRTIPPACTTTSAAARAGRRDRTARHLRPLQPARGRRRLWRTYVELLDETAAAGGRMFAQVHSRALTVVLSFKTNLPFDRLPVWKELRALPLDEQKRRLRDPELRRRLVEAARERDERRPIGAEARPAVYDWIFVMDTVEGPHRSVAEIARERGVDPVEAMIDLALEKDLDRFFLQPIANENQDHALELIKHPRTVGDLLRLGRPRLADHGRLAPDPSAQPLGAREAGAHARAGGPHADLRHRDALGLLRPRPDPRGLCRRPRRLRSRHDRARDARGGQRPARRGEAPDPARRGASPPPWSTARSCCATASTRAPCPGACCAGRSPEDLRATPSWPRTPHVRCAGAYALRGVARHPGQYPSSSAVSTFDSPRLSVVESDATVRHPEAGEGTRQAAEGLLSRLADATAPVTATEGEEFSTIMSYTGRRAESMPTSVRLDPKTERVIRTLARRTDGPSRKSSVTRFIVSRLRNWRKRRGQTAFEMWRNVHRLCEGRAAGPVGAYRRTCPLAPPRQATRMTFVDAGPLVAILHRDDRRHRDCSRRCARCPRRSARRGRW